MRVPNFFTLDKLYMSVFIKVDNIVPRIPGVKFDSPISFTMNEGDVWTFYGPNGSGKTLLTEIICGRYGLSSGNIEYPFLEEERQILPGYMEADGFYYARLRRKDGE